MSGDSPIADLTSHLWPPPEIAVIGAGVGGLVTAVLLEHAKIPYIVLEKRRSSTCHLGADLVLFPPAITILRDIGLPHSFWVNQSSRIDHLHLCKSRNFFQSIPTQPSPTTTPSHDVHGSTASSFNLSFLDSLSTQSTPTDGSSSNTTTVTKDDASIHSQSTTTSNYEANYSYLDAIIADDPVNSICLANVFGPDLHMCVLSRPALITELINLIPREKIVFDTSVIQVSECENHVEVVFTHQHAFGSLLVPLVIGADGIQSVCRQTTSRKKLQSIEELASSSMPRNSGEIFYRGILPLPQAPEAQKEDEKDPTVASMRRALYKLLVKDDFHKPRSMSIYHDRYRRTAFGFLNESGTWGYWVVREKMHGSLETLRDRRRGHTLGHAPAHWPEHLKAFFRLTHPDMFYIHPAVQREDDGDPRSWYSNRCVLLGDAAHPTMAKLLQSTNSTIEDAHLLVNLIRSHPPSVSPIVYFEQYANVRAKHVLGLQREVARQEKVGQLHAKAGTALWGVALRLLPVRLMESKLRKHSGWDPGDALREALRTGLSPQLFISPNNNSMSNVSPSIPPQRNGIETGKARPSSSSINSSSSSSTSASVSELNDTKLSMNPTNKYESKLRPIRHSNTSIPSNITVVSDDNSILPSSTCSSSVGPPPSIPPTLPSTILSSPIPIHEDTNEISIGINNLAISAELNHNDNNDNTNQLFSPLFPIHEEENKDFDKQTMQFYQISTTAAIVHTTNTSSNNCTSYPPSSDVFKSV